MWLQFGFINLKGYGFINLKELFGYNVLNSSHNLGSSAFCNRCVGGSVIDSMMFQVCWDLQVLSRQTNLHSSTVFFFVSVLVDVECYARKSYYVCCFVHEVVGTWILKLCWRLIHSPNYKLFFIHTITHSSSFFVTWFRVRTRFC